MRDEAFGERIRQARKRLGLTQAALANQLGVIKLSVARYEAGRVPRADLLDKMARLTGVTTQWLLHGEADSEAKASPQAEGILSEAAEGLLRQLRSELLLEKGLPLNQRQRYRERIKEISARVRRELEEYRRVLVTDHRQGRAHRRKDSFR